ncbi:DUF459 domain-containing protein [uncultured Bilophila sp.]|uniref:DUF459 domain-containing protein n=1 Tax=uncultured Bilophila sp. TaxID=529385 RepID=UPI0026DB96F4|nr:DUF459 domain-containing protein [uncultured Bilophila sp.]
MKNPFRAERGTLTSGRACAVYALAFVLMLFLDAGRFSGFLDRAGIDFAPAATLGQMVRGVAEASGLHALSEAETRLVADLATDATVGAVAAPQAAPAGHPVADALADFSRGTPPPVPSPSDPPVASAPTPAEPVVQPSVPAVPAPPAVGPSAPEAEQPPVPARVVDPARKPLVLLVGDSMMMEGFGPVLQRTLRKRPDMDVVREGKYSTGLSRQDYFDWPANLETLINKYNPDLVVICMGANDPQDIIDENRKRHHADSESWKRIYRSRAERLLAVATAKGAKVVWAGLPIMGKEPYSTRVRRLSDLQKQACEVYNAAFVDTTKVLADAHGAYTTFKVDDKGRHIRLRYKDMVHVTEDGGAMLTAAVEPVVEKELGLGKAVPGKPASAAPGTVPAPGTPATSSAVRQAAPQTAPQAGMPFSVQSAVRGAKIACYAFLPADRKPGERFPVVYLLHGAFENAEVWNARAGDLLSRLATRERLVLIAPSCGKTGWYADSPHLKKNRIESFVVRELMPAVERSFPVLPRRGVLGMSMGGHGAFALALRHPGLFASVSSMSGVLDITRHPDQWKIKDVLGPLASNRALWKSYSALDLLESSKPAGAPSMLITTGAQDAYVVPENRAFRDALRKGGFVYQYREAPGIHDWAYWLEELPLHLAFHAGVLNR